MGFSYKSKIAKVLDVSFYITKLRLLKSWLYNKIDGIDSSLEDLYYRHQVSYEMREINREKKKEKVAEGLFITDHAYDMAKERLSMNRTSFEKLTAKAFVCGIKHSDSAGNLKKYIDSKFFVEKSANNIRIYGENVFIFSKNVLVTVYQVPTNLRKSALKLQKEKK